VFALPLEDIVEVSMLVRDRYRLSLDMAAKVVAFVVEISPSSIEVTLRACREEAERRDQCGIDAS